MARDLEQLFAQRFVDGRIVAIDAGRGNAHHKRACGRIVGHEIELGIDPVEAPEIGRIAEMDDPELDRRVARVGMIDAGRHPPEIAARRVGENRDAALDIGAAGEQDADEGRQEDAHSLEPSSPLPAARHRPAGLRVPVQLRFSYHAIRRP